MECLSLRVRPCSRGGLAMKWQGQSYTVLRAIKRSNAKCGIQFEEGNVFVCNSAVRRRKIVNGQAMIVGDGMLIPIGNPCRKLRVRWSFHLQGGHRIITVLDRRTNVMRTTNLCEIFSDGQFFEQCGVAVGPAMLPGARKQNHDERNNHQTCYTALHRPGHAVILNHFP